MLASLFRSRIVRPMSYGCVGCSTSSASTARASGLETLRVICARIYDDEYTDNINHKYMKLLRSFPANPEGAWHLPEASLPGAGRRLHRRCSGRTDAGSFSQMLSLL